MTIPIRRLPVVIIGGGPAGLMAASRLSGAPASGDPLAVAVYDAMPSLGRKFLRAGVGGLNLTHSESLKNFSQRYYPADVPADWVAEFGPAHVVAWAKGLGISTFTGSSGRVFPEQKKASPLLRAWLQSLRNQGVDFFLRHRWLGFHPDVDSDGNACQVHRFQTPTGEISVQARATILALGGGSWARLGSDGEWLSLLSSYGINCAPFKASNCGFNVPWSGHMQQNFAGEPLKSVELSLYDNSRCVFRRRGEALISRHGIQGSLIYAASRLIQQQIADQGQARLLLDLLPDMSADTILQKLASPRGKESRSNYLRKRLGLSGVKLAMLYEFVPAALDSAQALADAVKCLPVALTSARPLDEAISTAGGITLDDCNTQLMLKRFEGVFCAGEMLAWDAPTGGYLLTACLASGQRAAAGVEAFLRVSSKSL